MIQAHDRDFPANAANPANPALRVARAPVRRRDIRVGELLAEGGEGRAYELPLRPDMVLKEYRRPQGRSHLDDLVLWPEAGDPALATRIAAATAWPQAVVKGSAGEAAGVLVPRAPRRFCLRHRDGIVRLATLSYLTADPGYRAVAYGLDFPPALSPERLGIVYALARVLEAFERLRPRVGHGDLSAKNVLWSLQRGPEVFVIDCDNCERYDDEGVALSSEGRRRAMTPNWDDPSVPAGRNPDPSSDRYSLALVFLRVVGAANFPVQARQRHGRPLTIDFPLPPGYGGEVLLGPGAAIWDLCASGLSTDNPRSRPAATQWVAALEAVLDGLGAGSVMRAVWASQGGGPSALAAPAPSSEPPPADVTIRPVVSSRQTSRPDRISFVAVSRPRPTTASSASSLSSARAVAQAWVPNHVLAGRSAVQAASPAPQPDPAVRQMASGVGVAVRWWLELHSRMVQSVRAPVPPSDRLRLLALCLAVDIAVAIAALFLAAMAVAPVLGI